MTVPRDPMIYDIILKSIEAGTGFFACEPNPALSLEEVLAFLKESPLDTFMYRYALGLISRLQPDQIQSLLIKDDGRNPFLNALTIEAAIANPDIFDALGGVDSARSRKFAQASPLIPLRAMAQPDYESHRLWTQLFAANLSLHRVLPSPEQAPRPFPYRKEEVADAGGVYITQIAMAEPDDPAPIVQPPSPAETAELALDRLRSLDILDGREMRHESSLSPYALLHKWRLRLQVDSGRHNYHLSGLQTAYGRGLDLDSARASYAMEIVERCSGFATIGQHSVLGCVQAYPIVKGSRSRLEKGGVEPIDPNAFGIDVPYNDEPLHWIQGERRTREGVEPVLVPVQSVFLFTNLDEPDLYAGHGSTGLASGNTMDEARMSALMELVERDGEATHPFHHAACFHIDAEDEKVAALLADYRARGIQFQFQDISPPYGIPCCKCFVTDMDGGIAKGTAASINGRRAVISALTETPYPYPYGPPSGPGMLQLPRLNFETLPDYSSARIKRDLTLVERLFLANGYAPIYVDLTRKDLQLPVVRALLPGVAYTADLDEHARVHPKLFGNYFKLFE
jgi:ribosomal protein S12 methylthiotransferase accessory factor YcaO